MNERDEILNKLKQEPLVSVAIGAVIGLALVFLFSKKDNPGIDKRMQKIEDKSKKIKEMEARLAEL